MTKVRNDAGAPMDPRLQSGSDPTDAGARKTTTLRYDDDGYPVPTTPAELAEQARLNSLHRARRTIVLEIDALHADQEDDRARALQAALDSIDHVFRMMLINGKAFQ